MSPAREPGRRQTRAAWRTPPVGGSPRWWWAAALAAALAGVPIATPAQTAPGAVRDAIAAVLDDDRFQDELPRDTPPTSRASLDERWRSQPRELTVGRSAGGVARALLLLLAAAAVVLVVTWLALVFLDPSRRLWVDPDEPAGDGPMEDSTSGLGSAPLDDAEALAARGEYAEAIHVLLLRTLDELRRRARTPFADSMTSREIVSGLEMPRAARIALSDLVTAVELTYFGGRRPAREHYLQCRERFERFATAHAGAPG